MTETKPENGHTYRYDGWQNVLTGLNITGKDWREKTAYVRHRRLSQTEIESLYEQDPIFARIIDSVPKHATRRWISVSGQDAPDDFNAGVLDYLRKLTARSKFSELLRLDRLDGGAAMIIGADDGKNPAEPLEFASIATIQHLNVVSRYEIFPGEIDRNPMSENFRNPMWYTFTGLTTTGEPLQRIHHSRIVRLRGIQTTERAEASRDGWGLPVAERVYLAIRQYGQVYEYSEALIKDLVQGVMTIKGLTELLAQDSSQAVVDRLALINLVASAFNMVILDEHESYERRTQSLGGIPEIMLKYMDNLAAAAEMPLSILFGQAPTGLSTDDQGGRRTFYDLVENTQEEKLRAGLERVIEAILWAQDGPTAGQLPAKWELSFEPLVTPSAQEDAATRLSEAQADSVYHSLGVLSTDEVRSRIENDPRSPYTLETEQDEFELGQNLPTLVGDAMY